METISRIYLDFLSNIFSLLFLLKYFTYYTKINIKKSIIPIFTSVYFIYSLFPSDTFNKLFVLLFDLLIVCIIYHDTFKKILLFYIKFECIYLLSFVIIFFLHSFLMRDFMTVVDSSVYEYYKSIICESIAYIIFVLHLNTIKMHSFSRSYQYYFNGIMIITLLILSSTTLYICKNDTNNNIILPLFFSAIYVLIAVYITLYDKFLALLAENALTKIQLEKSRLEQQYSYQLEEKLKLLHSIRHDIKNHLIIIDGYAVNGNSTKIHNYIQNISNDFTTTYLIDTPSDTISSILNAKYQECLSRNIDLKFTFDFNRVHIDDYYIITILGNLLDNAITAASKLPKDTGYINLSIFQVASYLEIHMENNHQEQIKTVGNDFVSTKKEETIFHGIGIKNARYATETLNGQMDIDYTDNTFTVSVMIPNY